MSDQEHERPLTRRELRLREQAEREGVDSIDELAAADDSDVSAVGGEQTEALAEGIDTSAIEIEIDPLHPDGTPRTRREMRELREAAIAAIAAEDSGDVASEAEAELETASERDGHDAAEHDSYGAPTEALSFEDLPNGDASASEEIDLDAPTEAFTLTDILDAAEPTSPTGDAEAVANLFAADEADAADEAEAEDLDGTAAEVDVAAVAEADVFEGAAATDAADEAAVDAAEPVAEADDADVAEVVDAASGATETGAEASSDEPLDNIDSDTSVEEAADGDDEEDTSRDTAGYSFPDIQPPEEWRSVFDDPARAASINAPGGSGDFDDLISRAVAQEGSTGGTGASALILPSHPGDTGGLTGPLGSTGELFVTGSIELPKSMGETGGHSGIHDSIDFDPFLTDGNAEPMAASADAGPMPVSALSAVSARRRPEVPVVAEPTKDRSKMPLILALSGGGLIVVVVGGVIWAASQGLFGN